MNENELTNLVEKANGTRRTRIITAKDIEIFNGLLAGHKVNPETKTIRVYPENAFVPNSYFGRAVTTYLQANRSDDGSWNVYAGTCDAHRAYGSGRLITINGR